MGKKLLLPADPIKRRRPRGGGGKSRSARGNGTVAKSLAEMERQLDTQHDDLLRRAEENTRRLTGKTRF